VTHGGDEVGSSDDPYVCKKKYPRKLKSFFRRAVPEIIGAVVLVLFGVLLLISMRFKTPTWDEPTHYSFGARMVEKGQQSRVTLSSMAVSQLNVLPNFYLRGDRVHRPRSIASVFASRIPTVLAAVLLGGMVFAFARRMFGSWAGLGSLVVFCLSPTILAHSRWVTNDVYCSLFMVSTIYAFWRYMETERFSWLILCGILFGAAQVSKFTSLLLFPILGILWLFFVFERRRKSKKNAKGSQKLESEESGVLGELESGFCPDQEGHGDREFTSDGFDDGFDDGLDEELHDGLNEGLDDGLNKGLDDGLNEGLDDALNEGFNDRLKSMEEDVGKTKAHSPIWRKIFRFTLFVLCAWIVWNGAYYFQDTFVSWGSRNFSSGFIKTVQKVLKPVPVGLPSPYMDALDVTFSINDAHSGRGNIYMMGETSKEGFRWYFLVALLYKVPLGFWFLFLTALFLTIYPGKRLKKPNHISCEVGEGVGGSGVFRDLLLFVPGIILLFYFLFLCTAQIGVRYLMPLLVLSHVFTGRLWAIKLKRQTRQRLLSFVIGGAVLWMGISSLSYTPHYLSYFNELVRDKKYSYRILADSNLDWNQNDRYLRWYLSRHGLSKANLDPRIPKEGTWVVSANKLVGVNHPGQYRWLRALDPVDHVAYSHLVFRADENDLRRVLSFERGELQAAVEIQEETLARGLWRSGYRGVSLSGPICRRRPVSNLRISRVCGRRDLFSARFVGFLRVPESGEYLLSLGSDDGSRLFVGNKKIIDLWSDHGLVYDHAVVNLEKGFHNLEIHFYERHGAALLRLRVAEFPHRKVIPARALFYRSRFYDSGGRDAEKTDEPEIFKGWK